MIKREEIISVGKFQKTHALKGELNMISDVDPEYFSERNPLIVECEGIYVPFYVNSVRTKGSTSYLVKIDGVENEGEASQFVNKEIFILKKDAEEWLEDIEDMETWTGYVVIDDKDDKKIGTLKSIDDTTANILFIIENDEGSEIYIPANEDFISEIDETNGIIRMNLPEGLLEL